MPERPIIRFEHLSPVEKAVYATGVVANIATRVLEGVLTRAADIIVEAEKAFEEGRNPDGRIDERTDIEEARFRDL